MRTATPLGKLVGMLMLCGITAAATATAQGIYADADRPPLRHESLESRGRLRALSLSETVNQAARADQTARAKKTRRLGYRSRKFALIRYEKPIQIAEKGFVFRMRALSKKQALMTLELLF